MCPRKQNENVRSTHLYKVGIFTTKRQNKSTWNRCKNVSKVLMLFVLLNVSCGCSSIVTVCSVFLLRSSKLPHWILLNIICKVYTLAWVAFCYVGKIKGGVHNKLWYSEVRSARRFSVVFLFISRFLSKNEYLQCQVCVEKEIRNVICDLIFNLVLKHMWLVGWASTNSQQSALQTHLGKPLLYYSNV